MIARIWHGRVSRSKADTYANYIRHTGLADYQRVPGNRAGRTARAGGATPA
jgi:hypothetical protein